MEVPERYKKPIIINMVDGNDKDVKELASLFAGVEGLKDYKFVVVGGRKIEAFFGVLTDEWKKKARDWISASKAMPAGGLVSLNSEGLILIMEALLSQ